MIELKIASRGKDYPIEQLKGERTSFFEKLLSANRTVGQLETKLHQLKVHGFEQEGEQPEKLTAEQVRELVGGGL